MLLVNEVFGPTIQGEGKSTGKEVIFLRLSGCNLACIWCDTPYTWNWIGTKFQHPEKFNPKDEAHKLSLYEVLHAINIHSRDGQVRSLVISGGEPLLQQSRLIEVLSELRKLHFWVEVETNGTVVPSDDFISLVDQFNCSPKLENCGSDNPVSKREVPEALKKLSSLDKTTFKFVISSEKDTNEILNLVKKYQMKNVYLMPLGRTKRQQLQNQVKVKRLSKRFGFIFSPRMHVLLWDTKRAV